MDKSELLIRPATLIDAEAMKSCVESAYQQYIPVIGKKPGPMLDDYARVIEKHQAFVAGIDQLIVGLVVLIKQESSMLLDNVAVNPEFQGKGFGRRLVSFVEAETVKLGYTTHELMIDNYRAYLRLGYIETDRRQVKGFSRIYMKKQLV